MNSTIEKEIRDTVETFVNDGFMFTAFDVTRTVRNKLGKGSFVSHNESNGIVQSMFSDNEMGFHIRDLINVGTGTQPWVYSHPTCDTSDYDPHWVTNDPEQDTMRADTTATVATVPATSGYVAPTAVTDDGDDDDNLTMGSGTVTTSSVNATPPTPAKARLGKNMYRLTKEGRLNVPINLARSAGFVPRQNVTVVNNLDGTLTVIGSHTSGVNTSWVRVNKDGRIRLGKIALAVIPNAQANGIYKIERDHNEIVIEAI